MVWGIIVVIKVCVSTWDARNQPQVFNVLAARLAIGRRLTVGRLVDQFQTMPSSHDPSQIGTGTQAGRCKGKDTSQSVHKCGIDNVNCLDFSKPPLSLSAGDINVGLSCYSSLIDLDPVTWISRLHYHRLIGLLLYIAHRIMRGNLSARHALPGRIQGQSSMPLHIRSYAVKTIRQ